MVAMAIKTKKKRTTEMSFSKLLLNSNQAVLSALVQTQNILAAFNKKKMQKVSSRLLVEQWTLKVQDQGN